MSRVMVHALKCEKVGQFWRWVTVEELMTLDMSLSSPWPILKALRERLLIDPEDKSRYLIEYLEGGAVVTARTGRPVFWLRVMDYKSTFGG